MSESKSEFVDVKYPHNKFDEAKIEDLIARSRVLWSQGKRVSSIIRELQISKNTWYTHLNKAVRG